MESPANGISSTFTEEILNGKLHFLCNESLQFLHEMLFLMQETRQGTLGNAKTFV